MGAPRIVFFALLILSVAVALWKGDKPERAGALVIVLMTVVQLAWRLFSRRYFNTVDVAAVVVDTVGVIGFGALAVHAKRVWPIWAASLQVLSIASHFAREVDPEVEPVAYFILRSGPTFLVLLVLLLGTILHQRRLRRLGNDPAWTDW
jgi:hypothetical protein